MKLITRSVVLACISIFSIVGLLQARTVNVYRNDNTFNQFRLSDSITLTHRLDSELALLSPDSISIPLATVDSIVMRTVDVPVLRFTFPERPELTWVPDKDNYISAILNVEGNGMVESADSLSLMVKGRGNSTWWFPKKPMRLKFKSKTSLCDMTKAKSYVLLADCMDASLMHNAIAFWVAKRIGIEFGNEFVPCHVYVNDKYAGAYLLTHKIGINKASVNIDDTKGVLIELSTEFDEDYQFHSAKYELPLMIKDPDLSELVGEMTEQDFLEYLPSYEVDNNDDNNGDINVDGETDIVDVENNGAVDEDNSDVANDTEFFDIYDDSSSYDASVDEPVTGDETEIPSPEPWQITTDDILKLWQEDFNHAELMMADGRASDAFDMRSFAKWMVVTDLVLNNEIGHPKSCYIYKRGLGGDYKYEFGPLWDFDLSFNSAGISDGVTSVTPYYGTLWLHPFFKDLTSSPEFMDLFREEWEYFENEVYPELLEWMDAYSNLIEPLARLNGLRWPKPHKNSWASARYNTFNNVAVVSELKTWIMRRVEFIHTQCEKNTF